MSCRLAGNADSARVNSGDGKITSPLRSVVLEDDGEVTTAWDIQGTLLAKT